MRKHTLFALLDMKKPDNGGRKQRHLSIEVAKWLRVRNALIPQVVSGQISDTAKWQMKECFRELDEDGSGTVTGEELKSALRAIDYGDPE